jgi:hypothetical protein
MILCLNTILAFRIQYSVCCGIILISTLIPLGALAFNPKVVGGVKLTGDPGDDDIDSEKRRDTESAGSMEKVDSHTEK